MGTPALELAADTNPNRFLNGRDWSDPRYAEVRQSIARFYREVLDGEAHPYGSKYPETIVTHWSREWEYPWAVLNAELAPGMRVVDLGCGGSPLLPYLARERGCIGVGIDTNFKSTTGRNNLRGFKEAPEKLFPEITWLQESMAEISLADSSMDRAFCISVMEHVARPVVEQTLAHVHRILRPGGLALITTDVDGEHRTLTMSYLQIIEAAEDAGLALRGEMDMTPPKDTPGTYDVVGFVLEKPA